MVGGTHSQLDKFEQLQSQQQLVTDARRTEEEARELESALQAQNEDRERFTLTRITEVIIIFTPLPS